MFGSKDPVAEVQGTDREYHLTAVVHVIREKYQTDEGRQAERPAVVLVPEVSSQQMRFLAAWLPDVEEEHFEIPMFVSTPVHSPFRGAIFRANEVFPQDHYIYVMTEAVVKQLLKCEGRRVEILSLPESQDFMCDNVKE